LHGVEGNQLRELLREFGIVMPKGITTLESRMPEILADAENGLPGSSRESFARLYAGQPHRSIFIIVLSE
jgi:transposase